MLKLWLVKQQQKTINLKKISGNLNMNLAFVPPACLSLHQNNLLCPSSNSGTQTTLICGDDATAIPIGLELIGAARQMYGCNRPLNVGKRSGKIVNNQ